MYTSRDLIACPTPHFPRSRRQEDKSAPRIVGLALSAHSLLPDPLKRFEVAHMEPVAGDRLPATHMLAPIMLLG